MSFKKIFLPKIILAALAILIGFFLLNEYTRNEELGDSPSNTNFFESITKSEQPSPFPFDELTIPYLRNRSFDSSLGTLERVRENSTHTAFLTSYDSDGLKINAQLTRPTGEMPDGGFPAIIFIHGYIPPSQYQTLSNYNSYVDYLAQNGFVVFKIDLRGHAQSEGDASGAYYSSDYIIDTLNAHAALSSTDFVNGERVGLWGHSMAGNVVFRSFVASGKIPAVVIFAGAVYSYSDWREYGLNDNSYRPPDDDSERARRRRELFNTHGEFDPNSEFWKQVVPTNYLDGLTGSVQLHHAVNDNVVNIGYSRGLLEILEDSQINAELFEYQNGSHNITGDAFNLAMQRTVEFFRNNL